MSYEGRVYLLCEKGHLTVTDAHDGGDTASKPCYIHGCRAPYVQWYDVDDTNGEGVEPETDMVTPFTYCMCEKCGDTHVLTPATFRPVHPEQWHAIPARSSLGFDTSDISPSFYAEE